MKNKKFNFNLCTFWTVVGADFVDNYFGEAINTVGNVVGSVVGVVGRDLRMQNNFLLDIFSVLHKWIKLMLQFFGAYYFKDALNDLLDQVGPVFTDFGNSAISLFTSNLLVLNFFMSVF